MNAISLFLLVFAQTGVQEVGQLTAATGQVALQRDGQTDPAMRGTGLRIGDQLATGPDSSAIIHGNGGLVIYLAKNSRMEIVPHPDAPAIQLVRGAARVVVGHSDGFRLLTPQVEARLGRGILRAESLQLTSTFCLETGTAELRSAERAGQRLQAGQQITHLAGRGFQPPMPCVEGNWPIQIEELRWADAAAASRSYKGDCAQQGAQLAREQMRAPTEATAPVAAEPTGATAEPGGIATATQASTVTGISAANLAAGPVSLAQATAGFGGANIDANQATLQGRLTTDFRGLQAGDPFPGNIHLITGQTRYLFGEVNLRPSDAFPTSREYYSIGLGASPTGQVTTGIGTGTGPNPNTIRIPKFDAYLVQLDQYAIADPVAPGTNALVGVPGLLGETPFNPHIEGATPLLDGRAIFNDRATFALGEFAVDREGNTPAFDVRRSDQDRQIIKDPNGNDAQDLVTPNPDVGRFVDRPDPLFFPQLPTVKVPDPNGGFRNTPRFEDLRFLRKAAFTTLVADQLTDYARRTGQTRFVVDGRIIDITGYKGR